MAAVTVVKVIDGKLKLDEEKLKSILCHPRAYNKNVIIISITGVYRKGKSTLLNFIKIYLEKKWTNNDNENLSLNGFLAKQGSEAVTKGIVMWSVPFIVNIDGEDIAVFLVDTEGAFEPKSDNNSSSAVFALSCLISSVQIFNVMQTIDQRDFELLALFGRYATAISAASREIEAFQKLVILVRDWSSPFDIKYGKTSLDRYLEKAGNAEIVSDEWKDVKFEFEQSFNDISCFLIPNPGEKATLCEEDIKSQFCFDDFKYNFILHIKHLIEGLFTDKVIKKVGGEKLRSDKMFDLFKEYFDVFKSGRVSPPENIIKATAKLGYVKAYEEAMKYYKCEIRKYFERKGYLVTINGVKEKLDDTDDNASDIYKDLTPILHKDLDKEFFEKFDKDTNEIKEESVEKAKMTENMRTVIFSLAGALAGVGMAKFTGMNVIEGAGTSLVGAVFGGGGSAAGNMGTKKKKKKSKAKKSN